MHTIRSATVHDLPGAYRVCLRTGDAGEDATDRFRDPDLLGHAFVGAYIIGGPDRALIVQGPEGVAGYCLAAADTRAFEAWCETSWWPALRQRYPVPGDHPVDAEIIRMFHTPPRASDAVVEAYPAHLHIDLLAAARGEGLGRQLVERQLADLRRIGSPGVHLDVASENAKAIAFYRHLGFVDVEPLASSMIMGRRLG